MNKDNRNKVDIDIVMKILKNESKNWDVPSVTLIGLQEKDAFKVLLSTIISLRTKDEVTIDASKRLFKILEKPEDITKIQIGDIEKAIYPCGFYKRKAIQIKKACERLVLEFHSKVPDDIDILMTFEGVGRKTANLVVSEGYGLSAMCVDTHVHRISNRLGYIKTKTPEESEIELRKKLPLKYWNEYNALMVAFGQSICRPISPKCSECEIFQYCRRIGVLKSR